jgi:hypothetical protein
MESTVHHASGFEPPVEQPPKSRSVPNLGTGAVESGFSMSDTVFPSEIWTHIYNAIREEFRRTRVFAGLVPTIGPVSDVLTIPSDVATFDAVSQRLAVDERRTTGFTEPIVQLALTVKQVQNEEELKTAVTLATRASNALALAQDILIARGQDARQFDLFASGRVLLQDGAPEVGLVDPNLPIEERIDVHPVSHPGEPKRYGENAFQAVADAYTRLYSTRGFPPPYASVFPPFPYADTWAGLPTTLIATADRIKPLVTDGYYPSFALPVDDPKDPTSPSVGIVFAPHGNTMDLVMSIDPTMTFQQRDNRGFYLFRVFMRFALRIKERAAVVQLRFT